MSTSELITTSFTRSSVSLSMSMLFSSTSKSRMSHDIFSWTNPPFGKPTAGRNSLSNTCENGPCPRSWTRPARRTTWMSSKVMLSDFCPTSMRRTNTSLRCATPSEWSKRVCTAPGKTKCDVPSCLRSRRRWNCGVSITDTSSGSTRKWPWTGSLNIFALDGPSFASPFFLPCRRRSMASAAAGVRSAATSACESGSSSMPPSSE